MNKNLIGKWCDIPSSASSDDILDMTNIMFEGFNLEYFLSDNFENESGYWTRMGLNACEGVDDRLCVKVFHVLPDYGFLGKDRISWGYSEIVSPDKDSIKKQIAVLENLLREIEE